MVLVQFHFFVGSKTRCCMFGQTHRIAPAKENARGFPLPLLFFGDHYPTLLLWVEIIGGGVA